MVLEDGTNWGSTNPYSWDPGSSCGQWLEVRAQTTYGTCTEYSNTLATTTYCAPTGTTNVNYPIACEGQVVQFTTTGLSGGETFIRYQYNWENQGSTEPTTGWVNWSTNITHILELLVMAVELICG